jgi:hypothetical protein
MSITDDRARRVFALEVAGLPVRYLSGSFDPTTQNLDPEITSGISYQDVEAIVSVGSFSANVDPSGGVANYNAVSITLASDRLRGDGADPAVIFGRCGARASGVSRAQITSDLLYETDSGSFTIDTDLTSVITTPALLHIGAETLRVSGLTSTTVTFSDRAVAGSQRQAHQITLEGVNVPEVSSAITTFRGRRASLYMADQYPGGELSDFTEIINGFIESSPIVEEGGTVSLALMPLTALLDSNSSNKSTSTRLLHGYHYFSDGRGDVLEWAVRLKDVGKEYELLQASVNPGAGTLVLNDDLELFWFGAPRDVDTGFDECHPRYPLLKGIDQRIYPTAGNYQTITYDTTNSTSPLSSVFDPIVLRTDSKPEIKTIQLGSNEVKLWPDVVSEELESYGPISQTGYDGAFAQWSFTPDEHITVRATSEPGSLRPQVILTTDTLRQLTFDGVRYLPRRWASEAVYPALERQARLWYPIDLRAEDDQSTVDNYPLNQSPNTRVITIPSDPLQMTAREAVRDVARAYYQWRELTILVEDRLDWLPVSATPGDYYWIQIKFHDRVAGETRSQYMKATHQTTATYDGSTVGYLIHLSPRQNWQELCSFGDWSEGDRVEVFAAARFDRERPGSLMLQLLQSGGGGLKNGSYDRISLGLSIPYQSMNEASFRAYDAASPFVFSGTISSDGLNYRDLIDNLLKAMGCVLIMKRQLDGSSAIYLQPIGAERSAEASASIGADDWLADQPPTWTIYEDIVTQTVIKYDYDPQDQSFGVEATFNNQESINRYGGERSKLELDLYALTSRDIGGTAGDTFGFFLPVISRLWNMLSNPLRMWRGSVGSGASMLLDVGSYVNVSSPLLKGYGDDWGVTDAVGMIQSINQELMGEGAQLDIIATGLAPVAWNQSARVITITSTTELEIATDIYSDLSVDDSSFYRVGDVVDYLPEGDHDNAITGLEIASITGNVLTFTSAHGVSATGGTLEPTTYTSASSTQQADAYLASNTSPPVLGSTTEAQRYS